MNNEIYPEEVEYRELIAFLRENATELGIVTMSDISYGPMISNSIRLGMQAEEEWDGPSIKPGELMEDHIDWPGAWLAGESWVKL